MLTAYQRHVRQYHFREQIALWDMETRGVFVLTWKEARNAWRNATRIARSYPPRIGKDY